MSFRVSHLTSPRLTSSQLTSFHLIRVRCEPVIGGRNHGELCRFTALDPVRTVAETNRSAPLSSD